ncbi:MAG: hypothetical protein EXR29_15400 [Betaproteobacteria bacterium]|nr:hypothetical protein [Betaproteobacteria bacterium]
MLARSLFRQQELAYRTQYAELKERALGAGSLLPGTPGSLSRKSGTGHAYWYRVFYAIPGGRQEDLVCRSDDSAAETAIRQRIEFAAWMESQVVLLRKLAFQVADKNTSRVLVEFHNRGFFAAGLTIVGTLAYMAWLNELGAVAVMARTQDLDLARREPLKLAIPARFLDTIAATRMPFAAVPGLPSRMPSTSVKLPGAEGLRVDMLTPGVKLGAIVNLPELDWFAQAIPHYDYLLEDPQPAAMLAGGHCVPVKLAQPARMVWHKLHSSTERKGFPEKAAKDRLQAMTLAAALSGHDAGALKRAFDAAPDRIRQSAVRLKKVIAAGLVAHPETAESILTCLERS